MLLKTELKIEKKKSNTFWPYLDIYRRFWTYNKNGTDNYDYQAGNGFVFTAVAHGACDVLGDRVGDCLALKFDVN